MKTDKQNSLLDEGVYLKSEQQQVTKSKNIQLCIFDKCGKIFSDRRSWEEHIRIHKGEKPFVW